MPSIIDLGMSSLDGILDQVKNMTRAIDRAATPLRDTFLQRKMIMEIPEIEPDDKRSVATVDGAMVIQKLASNDLVQVGAVAAEGVQTTKLFQDDGPATFCQYLVEHDGKMDKYARALMGIQELVMVDQIPHNVRIMDGAWSPAVVSILFTFLTDENGSALLLHYILDQLKSEAWDGHELPHAMDRIISPWNYVNDPQEYGTLVAIGKSDTASTYEEMARKLIAESKIDFPADQRISDRTLAGVVLHPGEMLVPRKIDSGKALWRLPRLTARGGQIDRDQIPAFQALDGRYSNHPYHDVARSMLEDILIKGYQHHDKDRISTDDALTRLAADKWVWSTYFKPSSGGEHHRALRIDFPRPDFPKGAALDGNVVAGHLADILPVIDADMMNEVQEPMSQYLADVRAKEISRVASMTIDHLVATLETERGVASFIRNYRT